MAASFSVTPDLRSSCLGRHLPQPPLTTEVVVRGRRSSALFLLLQSIWEGRWSAEKFWEEQVCNYASSIVS